VSGISLVAYNLIPGRIFVKDPSLRGRWMITDICVAYEPCPHCKALIGEPCYRMVQGRRSYSNNIHCARKKQRVYDIPKIRLNAGDYNISIE
jgi:hypothetical protein